MSVLALQQGPSLSLHGCRIPQLLFHIPLSPSVWPPMEGMPLYTPDIVYLFPAYLELQSSTAAITGQEILCTLLIASAKRTLALSTCLA